MESHKVPDTLFNLAKKSILRRNPNFKDLQKFKRQLPKSVMDEILKDHTRNCITYLIYYYLNDRELVCRECVKRTGNHYIVGGCPIWVSCYPDGNNTWQRIYSCSLCHQSCIEESELGCRCK